MSGHNNPIKLALWESLRMDPSLSKPDVVVSVGTGTRKNSVSPRSTSFRHVLFDGCIPRLLRAYMSSFDGESNFRDVVNNLDEESRDDYKRLNIFLPINEPGIDNTSRMRELRESVHQNPQLMGNCQMTVYALLITTFYFELDGLPRNLPGDRFQCSGMIRCRLPGKAIVEVLERVHPSADFRDKHKNTRVLQWKARSLSDVPAIPKEHWIQRSRYGSADKYRSEKSKTATTED